MNKKQELIKQAAEDCKGLSVIAEDVKKRYQAFTEEYFNKLCTLYDEIFDVDLLPQKGCIYYALERPDEWNDDELSEFNDEFLEKVCPKICPFYGLFCQGDAEEWLAKIEGILEGLDTETTL
jgi:hypothetical protein